MDLNSLEQPFTARSARRNRFIKSIFTAALVCSAAAVSAQTIYKQVDSEGRTSFTDRPEAAALTVASYAAAPVVHREEAASEDVSAKVEPVLRVRDPAESAPAVRVRAPIPPSRAKSIDQMEAYRRLQQAEHELGRGVEVQHGEPPMSGSMPGERQRERLEKLRRNVEAAQARVREVNAQGYAAGYSAKAASPAAAAPMVLAGGASGARAR